MPTTKEVSRQRLLDRRRARLEKKYQEQVAEEKRLLAEIGETPESVERELARLKAQRDRIIGGKGGGGSSKVLYTGKMKDYKKEKKKSNWGKYKSKLSNKQYNKLRKKYGPYLTGKEEKKVIKYIKKHSGDSTNLSTSMAKSKALSRDQLAALKMVRPDVAAHKTYGKNAKGLLAWWDKYGKKDPNLLNQINEIVSGTGGDTGGVADLTGPSYDLQNDPNYQALPDDLKKVAAYFENVGLASNTEQGTRLIQALGTAASQADAYMKQYFRIAEDTMIRTADEYSAAFGSASSRLNRRITELQEDLAKNKEFLTLEEQSDMTRMANEYKFNLQATQGTMAAAGLTQSTIRTEAETRLAEQHKGLVEDTQRQYGKRIQELETYAARGSTQARTELEDLQRSLGYNITNLGRTTEEMMGSARMPALAGYTPIGNITGKLAEQRTGDIMSRAQALMGEANLESLNLNL